jgi:uncharacterized membrane protein
LNNENQIVKLSLGRRIDAILKPEHTFLLLGFVFGIAMSLLTPPFQVPDEPNHFYRAIHISEGNLFPEKTDDRIGGSLPVSIREFKSGYEKIAGGQDIEGRLSSELLRISVSEDREFYDFPNSALYPVTCYLPQAASVALLSALGLKLTWIFYGARLAAFFFWLLCLYHAIRLMPFGKWLFTLLALLPMSLYINMSISADVVTNAVSFLFIAYCFHLAATGLPLNRKQLISLFVLLLLVVSVKQVYAALALLILIIPGTAFKNRKSRLIQTALLLAAAFAVSLSWSSAAESLYLSREAYNPHFISDISIPLGVDMHSQKEFLFDGNLGPVLGRSFAFCWNNHQSSYVGLLGWINVPLPTWLTWTAYFCIILFAVFEGGNITPGVRVLLGLLFILLFTLVLLSQYLSWHVVGYPQVEFIQGRYLIPVYPLFFLLLLTPLKAPSGMKAAFVLISVLLLNAFSLIAILERYKWSLL